MLDEKHRKCKKNIIVNNDDDDNNKIRHNKNRNVGK